MVVTSDRNERPIVVVVVASRPAALPLFLRLGFLRGPSLLLVVTNAHGRAHVRKCRKKKRRRTRRKRRRRRRRRRERRKRRRRRWRMVMIDEEEEGR